ncbi:MAG TPA: site-specific integrase [Tepidisphaeraceae bacterium]|jgi:integrase
MPKLTASNVPAYSHHKASGQAVVWISGNCKYLGKHGTKESREKYDRFIGEWLAAGRQLTPAPEALTIAELMVAYLRHCQSYYRNSDGTMSREIERVKLAIRPLAKSYSRTPVAEFTPMALKAIRKGLVDADLSRTTINQWINSIRRMFRWGVSEGMVGEGVLHALEAVEGLRFGRSEAREGEPVKAVDEDYVAATLAHLSPTVADMVRVQLLTGMRSGELVKMRGCDLNTTGNTWVYTPSKHKTARFGHKRAVYFGPKGQQIVGRYLKPGTGAFLFSPAEMDLQRRQLLHSQRMTPPTYGNFPGTNRRRKPKKCPGARYTSASYRRAIATACEKAFGMPQEYRKAPKGETPAAKALRLANAKEWRNKHVWYPLQVRHTAATKVRREFGIEAAQHILGHASINVTEIYAEKNAAQARKVMEQIG